MYLEADCLQGPIGELFVSSIQLVRSDKVLAISNVQKWGLAVTSSIYGFVLIESTWTQHQLCRNRLTGGRGGIDAIESSSP